MNPEYIAFVASSTARAQEALRLMTERYGNVEPKDADVVVALGGDGFMLQTMHRMMDLNKPMYGLKRGTVGFLMNRYKEDDLPQRLEQAHHTNLRPLRMKVMRDAGTEVVHEAINEVSLLRQTRQAAKIRVWVNDTMRIEELVCDGVLVSTPAGSTAYNLSAHGPILPLDSNALALTPISPFRPRRWRGALLPREAVVRFEIMDYYKRPVSATADASEVRDIVEVEIAEDPVKRINLLFDPEHNLEDRILAEQFTC